MFEPYIPPELSNQTAPPPPLPSPALVMLQEQVQAIFDMNHRIIELQERQEANMTMMLDYRTDAQENRNISFEQDLGNLRDLVHDGLMQYRGEIDDLLEKQEELQDNLNIRTRTLAVVSGVAVLLGGAALILAIF